MSLYLSVVFICFEEQTLFVNEDNTVASINITLTNPLSTDLTITINTMDSTATGKCLATC